MPAKRIYLAGPMTGMPEYNYPAFHAEAARLRAVGYHVENPAENSPQPDWDSYMRQALRQMLGCDLIALLPGWQGSRGAVLERSVALQVGLPIVEVDQLPTIEPEEQPLSQEELVALTPNICRGTGQHPDRCQCPYHAPNT